MIIDLNLRTIIDFCLGPNYVIIFQLFLTSEKTLNYLFIRCKGLFKEDETFVDSVPTSNSEGYLLKNANFEDAGKSLLLFHLSMNNLIGDYDKSYFAKYDGESSLLSKIVSFIDK